jgi:hypothetical protein
MATHAATASPPHRAIAPGEPRSDVLQFFSRLADIGTVLSIKLYRLTLDEAAGVPILPCLDHEAMLHERIPPHAAAYVQDRGGDLHEVVCIPDARRIDIDSVSTLGERSDASQDRLGRALAERFPGFSIKVIGPSWVRGDLRVAKACRAQVTLRDVLTGPDLDRIKRAVDRLQTISSLMEKQSRVASWGARTAMAPLLAVAGFLSYLLLGAINPGPRYEWVPQLRYAIIGLLGGYFLYFGLKAVQLTEMANRVWKRSAEYGLILAERRRLADAARR